MCVSLEHHFHEFIRSLFEYARVTKVNTIIHICRRADSEKFSITALLIIRYVIYGFMKGRERVAAANSEKLTVSLRD